MKRLWFFSAVAALTLGSATPPPSRAIERPRIVEPAVVLAQADPKPVAVPPAAPEVAPIAAPEPSPPAAPEPVKPAPEAAEPTPAPAAEEDRPTPGGIRVVVSLPLQKAYVFEDGELLDTSPVSTGKKGHETPVGTFPILQKKVRHRSNRYANAPMPYMQRLTHYGIALHAGSLPGYPASHGCIRLPRKFAKKLYGLTRRGTLVTVTKRRPKSAEEALAAA